MLLRGAMRMHIKFILHINPNRYESPHLVALYKSRLQRSRRGGR